MEEKQVVLLAPTPPPIGGIAMWTVRMMNAKLKHGWKVDVVDEKIIGNREFFGDRVKHNIKDEIKRCFNIWHGLTAALRDKNTSVVHSCIPANTQPVIREYICAIITKVYRRQFIIHFRCTVPNMVKSRLNKFVVKKICNISDCVMVLNKQSADFIKSITKTRVQIIPNFVDTDEFKRSHIIRDTINTILYVGGLIESKGCLDLIEIAKNFPEIEFRFIGNPETKVKNAAAGVKNVKLLGTKEHSEIAKELQDADVFAFLTYYNGEGFSNSLAEAMAAGVPCLVTDWAANKDMIEDKGGVVIPIKSPGEAIKGLKSMMPKEVRERQSAFNLNKVYRCYTDRTVLDQYVDCYEWCVGKRHMDKKIKKKQ